MSAWSWEDTVVRAHTWKCPCRLSDIKQSSMARVWLSFSSMPWIRLLQLGKKKIILYTMFQASSSSACNIKT